MNSRHAHRLNSVSNAFVQPSCELISPRRRRPRPNPTSFALVVMSEAPADGRLRPQRSAPSLDRGRRRCLYVRIHDDQHCRRAKRPRNSLLLGATLNAVRIGLGRGPLIPATLSYFEDLLVYAALEPSDFGAAHLEPKPNQERGRSPKRTANGDDERERKPRRPTPLGGGVFL